MLLLLIFPATEIPLMMQKRPHKNADFESPNIEEIKKNSLRLLNIDQANLVETFKEDTAIAV
ncbi:MAG: hypothetical protein ACQER7_11235 [Bacteroidota bacterium]